MRNKRILVIDDNPELVQLVECIFGAAGATVEGAISAVDGLRRFRACQPDLVVLDVMMPDLSGWEVCSYVRRVSDVPVIMLSALADSEDIAQGFARGATVYITKPFSPKVLLARAEALLQHAA
ncbi:MAG: response regulator transcription factor [Anaerolineae bacterium]